MDKVLYFPTINLPKNNWTTQSLLYWDQVLVIVPSRVIEDHSYYSKFMLQLVQENLVYQEIVENYEYKQHYISDLVWRSFAVNKEGLVQKQKRFSKGQYWRIHNTKFDHILLDSLVDYKLANRVNIDWYNIETSTAKLMMIYLATAIASEKKAQLSTDSIDNINPNLHLGLVDTQRDKIRSSILENIFPFPLKPPINKLLSFKEKYGNELKSFRRLIEQQIIIINGIPDLEQRNNYLNSKIEEINDRKIELTELMKKSKLGQVAKSTLKGLIIDAGITLITGGTVVPAASILSGINEIIKQYNGNPIKNNELGYLALVENKLL